MSWFGESTTPTTHRAVLEVLADGHFMRKGSRTLLAEDYIMKDADGNRYLYPGLIIAEDTAGTYYLVFSDSTSYGTNSDVAVGVLREFHNATLGDPIIDPIVHGKLIEAHCYEYEGTFGTISAGVKTELTLVEWV